MRLRCSKARAGYPCSVIQQASILEDLRTAEENEQADAEKMAQEKAERDAFEHEYVPAS